MGSVPLVSLRPGRVTKPQAGASKKGTARMPPAPAIIRGPGDERGAPKTHEHRPTKPLSRGLGGGRRPLRLGASAPQPRPGLLGGGPGACGAGAGRPAGRPPG
eukprot:scaffold4305_cov370-Prasinococcus_capsulatus_cf.AAC.5